jgi:hypothetical protein
VISTMLLGRLILIKEFTIRFMCCSEGVNEKLIHSFGEETFAKGVRE